MSNLRVEKVSAGCSASHQTVTGAKELNRGGCRQPLIPTTRDLRDVSVLKSSCQGPCRHWWTWAAANERTDMQGSRTVLRKRWFWNMPALERSWTLSMKTETFVLPLNWWICLIFLSGEKNKCRFSAFWDVSVHIYVVDFDLLHS